MQWPKKRGPELLLIVFLFAVVTGALAFCFGAIWLLAGIVLSPLVVAWRYDNQTGACLPLAVLVIITLGVMALLLYLMAVTTGAVR